MPKTLTDIAIETELQESSDEEKALFLAFSKQLKGKRGTGSGHIPQPISFRNHIIMIGTFPFALSIMLIRAPVMIPGVINFAPFALLLGAGGLWLARRRGLLVENRFLALMLISFGISTAFIAPLLAAGTFSNGLPPLVSASVLYGVTLAIFVTLSYGLYGVAVNFQKPPQKLVGVSA
jgi:hypothetical protein